MQAEVKWLMDYLDRFEILPEMEKAINLVFRWAHTEYSYASKNSRIQEWRQHWQQGESYKILCQIFAGCLLHPQGMTYQALIGYIAGNIGCASPLDRAKCAAEIIALAYQADLITITRTSDQTILVTTEFTLSEEIPHFNKHLPSFRPPEPATHNPMLGGLLKQNTVDVCLDHIDRMNAIPLSLETRLLRLEEAPNSPPETPEQQEAWEAFQEQSAEAYEAIQAAGNRFYMTHSYDTRGRCYCGGYYVTYQGSQYKKALVQLANKEIVKL